MMSDSITRETVAVDIDDVLAMHIEAFIEFSNTAFGTQITPDTYFERWSVLWGLSEDEVMKRALQFHTAEQIGNFGVIEHAQSALSLLKQRKELVIVTARPAWMMEITTQWLDRHFQGIFSNVHSVPIWEPDNQVTKADVCKQIGADYLIDDLIRHCNIAAASGIKTLLFSRSTWDQKLTPHPDVIRVKDWNEIVQYFTI